MPTTASALNVRCPWCPRYGRPVTVLAFHGDDRAWSDGLCLACAVAVRAEYRAAREGKIGE